MRVKRWRNVKYLIYKNNAEKNGTFHMQIMIKGGNKHRRIIYDTCSKLSIRAQNGVAYFHFEQLSITFAVSLLPTFNKYAASGVLSFSMHHFYVSKYIQWERTQVYVRTFDKKQTKNEKNNMPQKKSKLFYRKVWNVFGKIFYCIRKYFIMWDVQSHSITRRSGNDLESEYF